MRTKKTLTYPLLVLSLSGFPSEKNDLSNKYPKEVKCLSSLQKEERGSFKKSFEGEEYGTRSYEKVKKGWTIDLNGN